MTDNIIKLKALQVYGWGYAPFLEPLPIGDLTLLYGANGSGKTTYLTALGLLLGVRNLPRGESYERYIRDGEDWAFLRAIVDNSPNESGKRPFASIIPQAEDSDTCTLACMIQYQSGSWRRRYFITPGDDFVPEPGIKLDIPFMFKLESYQTALENVGVRQALLKLLELGVLGIRDMREPKALFDFFVKLVGNEDIRTNYNGARRSWREVRDRADRLQDRFEVQRKDVQEVGEQIKLQQQRREVEARLALNYQLVDHAHLRDMQSDYEKRLEKQSSLLHEKQDADWELGDIVGRGEQLESEQATFDEQYQEWLKERDTTETEFRNAEQQTVLLKRDLSQLSTEVESLRTLPDVDIETVEAEYQQTESAVTAQRDVCYRLQGHYDELKNEQDELLSGQTPLPRYVTDFLNKLQEEHIPYTLLADTVSVTDPRWLRAVEGALGGERFTVLVESEKHQLQAKRIAQQTHYRHWISPPKSESSVKHAQNSLLDRVEVADESAWGWVADRLSGIQCVESIEEGHKLSQQNGNITITPEAYWQEARGGRSVWVKELVCGAAAREQRLREIEAQLEEVRAALEAEQQSLRTLQQRFDEIRELLDAAKKRLSLPQKEAELADLQARFDELEQEAASLKKTYQELKSQEQVWNDDRTRLALAYQDVERKRERLEQRIQKLQHDVHELRVPELREEIQELEVSLPDLPPELQQSIQESGLSSGDYREQITADEQRLERIPEVEIEYNEELYHQQVADLDRLRGEVEDMRTRAREARELFDRATGDYSHHIDQIFSQGMNREFRQLCRAADAQSAITVLKSESDLDDWSLDIRVGFDGKARLPLSSAPLSRGQEVLTGLYLVLAALRAVKATPILILDELMSLLDERNAPRVLAGLRDAGVQCFVATPQSRPGADEFADVMWGFFKRPETELYAPPIAVVARRENGA